jgi:hypothetical protein
MMPMLDRAVLLVHRLLHEFTTFLIQYDSLYLVTQCLSAAVLDCCRTAAVLLLLLLMITDQCSAVNGRARCTRMYSNFAVIAAV